MRKEESGKWKGNWKREGKWKREREKEKDESGKEKDLGKKKRGIGKEEKGNGKGERGKWKGEEEKGSKRIYNLIEGNLVVENELLKILKRTVTYSSSASLRLVCSSYFRHLA